MFVYLLPGAFFSFCTCPAYNRVEMPLQWASFLLSLFLFCLNLITFPAPHIEEVLELMTLPKTVTIIPKYHPLSQSFSSTLIWVTVAFLQAKQRPLGRALRKYDIFPGTAWSDNTEDLMIHALIWNSPTSG